MAYLYTIRNAQTKAAMTRQEKIEALKSNNFNQPLTYRYVATKVNAPGDNDDRTWTRHELFVYNSHGAQVFGGCEASELKCYQAAARAIRWRHMDWRPSGY